MIVYIDEPGGNDEAFGVDRLFRSRAIELAHGGDPPIANGEIPDPVGIPGAIDNPSIPDEYVEILGAECAEK
jgi:hypothetical protein